MTPEKSGLMSGRTRPFILFAVAGLSLLLQGCLEKNLFEAVSSGNERLVRDFLEDDPGSLFSRDSVGRTPLHRAVDSAQIGVVRLLLEAGADPSTRDRNGFTPLDHARLTGVKPLVDLLLEYVALSEAVRREDSDLIHKVIVRDPTSLDRVDSEGKVPLHYAVPQDGTGVLVHLLREGADPNIPFPNGVSPLQMAIREGNLEKTTLLLEAGADPDRLDPEGLPPLHDAISQSDPAMVPLLLKYGCNPNIPLPNGDTPLHLAVEKARTQAVEALLAGGALPDVRNLEGESPLELSRKLRRFLISALIEQRLQLDDD